MAEFTFGQNILRYIQNQDELNLKNKELDQENARYQNEINFKERQAQLQEMRWNADYNLDLAKYQQAKEKDFNSENSLVSLLPEDVRKQIPTEMYKYRNGQIYVPRDSVSNIEQGLTRQRELAKDQADLQYKDAELNISKFNSQTSRMNANETKRHNLVMESKTTEDTNRLKQEEQYKINFSKAESNLALIKSAMQVDDYKNKQNTDYVKYKKEATDAVYNALGNVGITNATLLPVEIAGQVANVNLLDFIRNGAALDDNRKNEYVVNMNKVDKDSGEAADLKRQYYNESIYSLGSVLSSAQLEALILWNEIGTR